MSEIVTLSPVEQVKALEKENAKLQEDLDDAEDEVKELKQELKEAKDDYQRLDDRNDELRKERNDLVEQSNAFEVYERTLELYADPANWTDGRFAPVMRYISADEPYEPARTALGG